MVTDWMRDLYCIIHDFRFEKRIREVITLQKPSLIYERFTDFHKSGLRVAKKAKVPYVVEIHETAEARRYTQKLNFHHYNLHVLMKVATGADIVVVASSMLRDYFTRKGVLAKRILVVPNAVDLDLFRSAGQDHYVRHRLGISANEIVVGFVGGMHPYHGIDLLPDVCELIRSECPKLKFLIVGGFKRYKGGLRAFKSMLEKRRIDNYFILTGGIPIEEVPVYIEAMDICLMPDSNAYGSPLKLFEYGALSKPCIMPRYQPVLDVLVDGQTGLIFQPKSVKDMTDKIATLMHDQGLRESLGRNLYNLVSQKHTWRKNARTILGHVSSIINTESHQR
jgi:glycosyltransferase involved in cell wall biosynthesis